MKASQLLRDYGPWALVTGASSGIGEQFAHQLAAAGFNLVLVARRETLLADMADNLQRERGIVVRVLAEDLSQTEAVSRIVDAVADMDVGLLVSNAGFGLKGALTAHQASELDAMLNVNARAPMLLMHGLLPRLRGRSKAGIILTGSIEGEAAFPWSAAYAASKAFLHSLGLGVWQELQGSDVDLLVLAPGSTDTAAPVLQGIAREQLVGLMTPAEVAEQALASLGRKPLHIPGWRNRVLVGLLRYLPRRWALAMAGKGMSTVLRNSGHPV